MTNSMDSGLQELNITELGYMPSLQVNSPSSASDAVIRTMKMNITDNKVVQVNTQSLFKYILVDLVITQTDEKGK